MVTFGWILTILMLKAHCLEPQKGAFVEGNKTKNLVQVPKKDLFQVEKYFQTYLKQIRPLQVLRLALSLDLLGLHDLDGGVIEHLLPRVVKLPVVGVGQEPLLGERDRLLGRGVHAGRPLVVGGRGLTFLLRLLAQLKGFVVRAGLKRK